MLTQILMIFCNTKNLIIMVKSNILLVNSSVQIHTLYAIINKSILWILNKEHKNS